MEYIHNDYLQVVGELNIGRDSQNVPSVQVFDSEEHRAMSKGIKNMI